MSYLLDANALIEAKRRYYAFDICPGYWDALLHHHAAGALLSLDRVQAELLRGNDDLKTWTEAAPATFFAGSAEADVLAQFARTQTWAAGKPQFSTAARAEFASKADAWLIAFAAAKGHVLVTHEEYAPDARRKIPMPNVCRDLGVQHTNVFEMLRALPVRFILSP